MPRKTICFGATLTFCTAAKVGRCVPKDFNKGNANNAEPLRRYARRDCVVERVEVAGWKRSKTLASAATSGGVGCFSTRRPASKSMTAWKRTRTTITSKNPTTLAGIPHALWLIGKNSRRLGSLWFPETKRRYSPPPARAFHQKETKVITEKVKQTRWPAGFGFHCGKDREQSHVICSNRSSDSAVNSDILPRDVTAAIG